MEAMAAAAMAATVAMMAMAVVATVGAAGDGVDGVAVADGSGDGGVHDSDCGDWWAAWRWQGGDNSRAGGGIDGSMLLMAARQKEGKAGKEVKGGWNEQGRLPSLPPGGEKIMILCALSTDASCLSWLTITKTMRLLWAMHAERTHARVAPNYEEAGSI